jgi:hypothetical protein
LGVAGSKGVDPVPKPRDGELLCVFY